MTGKITEYDCQMCGKKNVPLCPSLVCECCHKSLTFEDCCDGTFNAKMLLRLGRSREHIKEMYPDAKI